MGELTDSMGKKQKILLYILLILYILYPICEIYYVSAPNLDNEESLKKYIEYFSRNISNSSNDEDIKELESLKDSFYMLSLVNSWTSIALPFIDFIIIIFYCCGLYNGIVTTINCCFICDFLYNCGCIPCFIKSALTCPLLLQSLAGIIIFITIVFLMVDYQDTKSIVKKLKKRLNIDKIYIELKSKQIYNALFLAAIIILLILSIVYYCLKKSCCCCCCCCSCCDDSSLPNPPKVEIIISQNESKNINQKQKSSYKAVSIK